MEYSRLLPSHDLFARTFSAVSGVCLDSLVGSWFRSRRFRQSLSSLEIELIRDGLFSSPGKRDVTGIYSSAWSAIHPRRDAFQRRRARDEQHLPDLSFLLGTLVLSRSFSLPPSVLALVPAEQFNLIPFFVFFFTAPSFFPCSYQCLYLPATPKWNHFRPDVQCFQIYYCCCAIGKNRVHVERIKSSVYNRHGRSNKRGIRRSVLSLYRLKASLILHPSFSISDS